MPVEQYAYFAVRSVHTSASEMTERLGIEPDETLVRGSRGVNPPVRPPCHSWKVVCREPGLPVDEQIARVLARLLPHEDRIVALVREIMAREGPTAPAVLEVVRYFDAEQAAAPAAAPGAHSPSLFGWHLDHAALAFLVRVGAGLDVDEYDYDLTTDES